MTFQGVRVRESVGGNARGRWVAIRTSGSGSGLGDGSVASGYAGGGLRLIGEPGAALSRELTWRSTRWLISVLLLVAWSLSGTTLANEPESAGRSADSSDVIPLSVCVSQEGAVVFATRHGKHCIRYFTGGVVEDAPLVVISFHGDRNPRAEAARDLAAMAEERLSVANRLSTLHRLPWIAVSRPGAYGSAGDHRKRRQLVEFEALNAVVDALKDRYGFEQVILIGHSGGATVVGALLTLGRDDVRCAILTSVAVDFAERARRLGWGSERVERELAAYDPLDHVASVKEDPGRTVFIVGDPRDSNTPFELQLRFAAVLRERGHRVEIVEAAGRPPRYHDLPGNAGAQLVSRCY